MLNFHIPNRQRDEKIIILIRRHYFIILIKFLVWIILAILPFLFYLMMSNVLKGFLPAELFYPIVTLFASIYYLYIWLFAFYSFVDYYLDSWIVTTRRIIDIEQKGLFNQTISEQQLYRIQDVTSEIKGFFATFLNYGNVYVQTAGELERFIFKQVPNPGLVAKKISELAEENKRFNRLLADADEKISTK
ncbi:MAG: PH domain-containing protein [Patescibacteria group bacterium]|jgi:uncharacterized membrane protein YdbT with pleckstrin-like domain